MGKSLKESHWTFRRLVPALRRHEGCLTGKIQVPMPVGLFLSRGAAYPSPSAYFVRFFLHPGCFYRGFPDDFSGPSSRLLKMLLNKVSALIPGKALP